MKNFVNPIPAEKLENCGGGGSILLYVEKIQGRKQLAKILI